MDYWEEYKEMFFMFPFILIAFAGHSILGGYYPIAFWGSIGFLVVGMVGVPYASELEGGRRNAARYNVSSLFEYGGNSVVQTWWTKPGKTRRIMSDRWGAEWETDQPLIPPYFDHPKYGPQTVLTYRSRFHPSVTLKEQDGKVYFRGSLIETSHVRLGTLWEYMTGPGIPIVDARGPRPVYFLAMAKGDYEIAIGQTRIADVKDRELQIAG